MKLTTREYTVLQKATNALRASKHRTAEDQALMENLLERVGIECLTEAQRRVTR